MSDKEIEEMEAYQNLINRITMSDKETKERIESDAEQYAKYQGTHDRPDITKHDYIQGATSERPKAWNEAIERCIQIIERADGDGMVYTKYLIKELESEKHKQS